MVLHRRSRRSRDIVLRRLRQQRRDRERAVRDPQVHQVTTSALRVEVDTGDEAAPDTGSGNP